MNKKSIRRLIKSDHKIFAGKCPRPPEHPLLVSLRAFIAYTSGIADLLKFITESDDPAAAAEALEKALEKAGTLELAVKTGTELGLAISKALGVSNERS
jgi:hypothetical protein